MFMVTKIDSNIIEIQNYDGSIHKIPSILFENNIKEGMTYRIISKEEEEEEKRKNFVLGSLIQKNKKLF